MKKLVITALMGVFAVATIHAQDIPERKKGDRKHFGKRTEGFKKQRADLNLSEEQKAQFKALNQDFQKKMAELKKQDNITVKESREKMQQIAKEHRTNVNQLLTAEQKAKIEKSKADRKIKMQDHGQKRGEFMKKELGLTDEQSAKLDASRKANAEKMKAIRENKSLSEEQKKEQIKALHEAQKNNLKSVLTDEQLKKLKERKPRTMEGKRKPSGDRKAI